MWVFPERLHLFQAVSWIVIEAEGVRELQRLIWKIKDLAPGYSWVTLDCLAGSLAQSGTTREFKLNSAVATSILLLA